MLGRNFGKAVIATTLVAGGIALATPAPAFATNNICGKDGAAADVCGPGEHQLCVVLTRSDGSTQDYCIDWGG